MQVRNAVLKWLDLEVETIPNVYVLSEWEPALDWEIRKSALEKTEAAAVTRPGAADFRALVLDEYSNKCAVTGCGIVEVLEVAHIVPYYGVESDDVQNAIVLRSDIHKLFDRGLLSFNYSESGKELQVEVSNQITHEYGQLQNVSCTLPDNRDSKPSKAALFVRNYLALKTD
jgi:hypothetical protein